MADGTYTGNGITGIVKDGVITLSGTTNGSDNAFTVKLQNPITVTQEMVDGGYYYHLNNTAVSSSFVPVLENDSHVEVTSPTINAVNRIVQLSQNSVGKTVTQIRFYSGAAGITLNGVYAPAFVKSSAVTPYTPYSNLCPISGHDVVDVWVADDYDTTLPATASISLPNTVYSGTLDVVSGVLTVTHKNLELDGSNDEQWDALGTRQYHTIIDAVDVGYGYAEGKIISNYLKYNKSLPNDNSAIGMILNSTNLQVRVNTETTTVALLRTYLANNPLDVVYELATPIQFQLDPSTISTLKNENYIWSDAGQVTVEYRSN